MALYIDKKYISLISNRLDKFSQTSKDVYNFRCPFCGDSIRNKTKKRGYLYLKKNKFYYKCHNCNTGTTFNKFLKTIDGNLHQEYRLELFKEQQDFHIQQPIIKQDFFDDKPTFEKIESIDKLPDTHIAKKYIIDRKIPKLFWDDLYYVPNFYEWASRQAKIKEKYKECTEPRLIIPFRDRNGNLIAVQGRALGLSKLRYVTLKFDDSPKFYGLDRINPSLKVFVTEGPFDSMFIPNCTAMAGSSLDINYLVNLFKIDPKNIVVIYDNEPRNKEICKNILGAINKGFSVVIWPDIVKEKDINDMILSGKSKLDIFCLIRDNMVSGLEAILKLNRWKKI